MMQVQLTRPHIGATPVLRNQPVQWTRFASDSDKYRVFVLEDEMGTQVKESVEHFFKAFGRKCQVTVFRTGYEALQAIDKSGDLPDLVFVDQFLPSPPAHVYSYNQIVRALLQRDINPKQIIGIASLGMVTANMTTAYRNQHEMTHHIDQMMRDVLSVGKESLFEIFSPKKRRQAFLVQHLVDLFGLQED